MKAYLGKHPKKWTLLNSEVDSDGEVEILCSLANLEVDSSRHSDPLLFSAEQSGLFEVRTPDDELVYYDCDNCISCDNGDTEVVVESANSTSLVVDDSAERVDGPISKQSSTKGEDGRAALCEPAVNSPGEVGRVELCDLAVENSPDFESYSSERSSDIGSYPCENTPRSDGYPHANIPRSYPSVSTQFSEVNKPCKGNK